MVQTTFFPFVQFLLFCLVTFIIGRGIVKFIFGDEQADKFQFLFPVMSLSFWAIFLGIGVALYVRLPYIVYFLWGGSLLLFAFGLWKLRISNLISWAGVTILPLILSLPFVLHGFSNFLGSPAPDGWAYAAYGQYLWEYDRCTEGGLAPLYQYGAFLCQTRYIASSFLLFISFFMRAPGEAQIGMGFLLPWAFWVYSSTLRFFIDIHDIHGALKWIYSLLGILSGWLFTVLFANNFDNALALSIIPAVVGTMQIAEWKLRKWWYVLGFFISAIIYIYPEMLLFLGIIVFIFFLTSKVLQNVTNNELTRNLIFGGGGILFLIMPYIPDLLGFIQRQIGTTYAQVRPGGNLSIEIVTPGLRTVSFWGLSAGDTYLASDTLSYPFYYWAAQTVSVILILFFLVGLYSQLKAKKWEYITVQLIFVLFITYFVFVENYGYGAYKIILGIWWLIVYFLVMGINEILNSSDSFVRRAGQISLIIILPLYIFFLGLKVYSFEKAVEYKNSILVQDLKIALQSINNGSLAISVQKMNPNLWALYYARDHGALVYPYRSYPITLARDYTERSKSVAPDLINFLLTDFDDSQIREQADLVWQNSIYYLWEWKSDQWVYIAEIDNPNGLETWEGKRSFWMGGEATEISLISSQSVPIKLVLDTIAGPSLPEVEERRLKISVNGDSPQFLTVIPGRLEVPISLQPGKNTITIQVLDTPTFSILPNGDTRPLLLGIRSIKFYFSTALFPLSKLTSNELRLLK